MRCILLTICLCLSNCSTYPPAEKKRNWKLIYKKELESAIKNNDEEAFRFFWPEYLKERRK
tara:strand:+ start:69 stop:251 length:183 start_codon:yes stop_codon:yes gene_type:complete